MSKVSKKKNVKSLLASVIGSDNLLFIQIIEERSLKLYKYWDVSTVKKLLDSLLPFKDQLKAVFLNASKIRTSEYSSSYESSKAIKDFLLRHSIPFHFFSVTFTFSLNVLVAANFNPSIKDYVVFLNVGENDLIYKLYQFTSKGYEFVMTMENKENDLEKFTKSLSELMKVFTVKKLILFTLVKDNNIFFKKTEAHLKTSKLLFIKDKLIVVDYKKLIETEVSGRSIAEMGKWLFDRSYVRFNIVPFIEQTFKIFGIIGDSRKGHIFVQQGKETPFKEFIVVEKSVQQVTMMQYEEKMHEVLETLKLDHNCHRRKIILLFESECFPEIKIESIIIPEIKELPKKLNGICDMKIPVIGFFDSSAVICVYKNDGYKFLNSWNGLYGNGLFINFEESKAEYGMESIKADKTKMSSVVYNLIKIMSMPSEKFVEKEEWKYVITKNSENPVLIEFVNHEGRKQAGTPSFLMAMLLKEILKRIKNELNEEKPKEIGLCFFDKMFEDEKKRVENGLKEACELLKVGCKFIDV
uniref:Uncharacterized protein n=1 Tax=Panagrolaimus sp. PS1159 TaxID=55785 RepID=A0AC35FXR5_9BILA